MNDMKLVKIQAVLERCAVSRATLYRMIEKGLSHAKNPDRRTSGGLAGK